MRGSGRCGWPSAGEADYLVAGRRLTLPGFVASLVTTWYGGILGVGEYGWSYGISSWLVFGVPYYLWAGVFALVLARRARRPRARPAAARPARRAATQHAPPRPGALGRGPPIHL